jgi:uncharacterized membrane protein YiaA
LNGAVELQPLSEVAIRNYLTAVKKEQLWALVEQNPALVRSNDPKILPLLKTPLFLSVFATVSPIVAVESEAELWDAYIVKQLEIPAEKLSGKGYQRYRATEEPTQKQTKNYLIFLAQQLRRTTEVMLIEEMQPTWLRSEPKVLGRSLQQWQYDLTLGPIGGLLTGLLMISLMFGQFMGLRERLILGLIISLMVGLLMGLIGKRDEIRLVEKLQISMSRKAQREILKYSTMGLAYGIFVGLTGNNMILGLMWGMMVGLGWGVIEGFQTSLKVRSEPNQGIKASIKNMAVLIPIGLIVCGLLEIKLIPYLKGFMTVVQLQRLPNSTAAAMMLFIIISISGGGLAFTQHVSLRITLYLSHQKPNDSQTRCIPWNYARFLSYAADRKLLQQTGGAYRFIHRSLLEHFAEMRSP